MTGPGAWSRRAFLGALGLPGAGLAAGFPVAPRMGAAALLRGALAGLDAAGADPEAAAAREDLWQGVQAAFTVDRSLINLNSGGVSPAPAVVQAAMRRHLDYSNAAPPYALWQILEPQKETVRTGLARLLGCEREEIAITRNASEGLQIFQLGFDLREGDEVLTSDQDYPRMLTTFEQRVRREGIVLRKVPLPVPAEDPAEVVARFAEGLRSRTRLILVCHMVNLTGQILPVREVVRLGRERGIPVIVDGAHSFAHFPFRRDDLVCDYFATSLHKWLFAPHGTGMLYVRRERIGSVWPMMAAPEAMNEDIRKFEEIGTHPAANFLAVAEAIAFHQGIGPERKAARLRYLRDRWATRLARHERVRLHTSLRPEFSCGIATVEVAGVDTGMLADHLWREHRILVVPIVHRDFQGLRVSPSVFTTLDEVDRFSEAVEAVLRDTPPALVRAG